MNLVIREAGAVAGEAERRKRSKYSNLISRYHFILIAIETRSFLKELGYHLRDTTLDPFSHHFLLQRISVAIQWGNATAILSSLLHDYQLLLLLLSLLLLSLFL